MKIISYESSRVTILFPLEEVLPLSGVNGPAIFTEIQNRYGFLKAPDPAISREEATKVGYKFGIGQISSHAKINAVAEFSIYTDGIVAEAKTSEIAEAFLEDIIRFLQSDLKFRPFSSKPKRFFYSQMVVEFEKPLAQLLHSFEKISDAISRHLTQQFELYVPMSFARLDFQAEKSLVPEPTPKFIIERRAGISFDRERYYSSAPMRTADHTAVLQEIESSIA